MMTEILNPKYGEKICDPACGTAGFLVAAYEHILREKTSKDLAREGNLAGDKMNNIQWSILREESLYGYDFDQTMVRISLMNLMMHARDYQPEHRPKEHAFEEIQRNESL